MDAELTLPNDRKQAVTQALLDLNYSVTDIANKLQISRSTVYRYKEKPLSEDLLQFATEIKTMFSLKQNQILAEILSEIEKAVKEHPDLKSLIAAFQIIKDNTLSLQRIQGEARSDDRLYRLLGNS
jgi:transposase